MEATVGSIPGEEQMTAKQLIDSITHHFVTRLKSKTGWGRNQVICAYTMAVKDALAESIELEGRSPEQPNPQPDHVSQRLQRVMLEAQADKDKSRPPTDAVGKRWINPVSPQEEALPWN